MMTDSDRRLKAFEEECKDLYYDMELSDHTLVSIDGVDAKAFELLYTELGISDFQLKEYVRKETDKYWNAKMLPSKTGDKPFDGYKDPNTRPQVAEIRTMSDIFPTVLYYKFIRIPKLELVFNALGARDHPFVLGKGDDVAEALNRKRANIESVRSSGEKKHSHLSDFQ